MSQLIYKIVSVDEWNAAKQAGQFTGSAVDVADGFIHFSAAHQVAATAAKHFAGKADLLLVAVEADRLNDLQWEVSRGGDKFPHLYATLPVNVTNPAVPLPLDENGTHVFPPEIDS